MTRSRQLVDRDLVAVEDEPAADEPRVEERLATAAADRLELLEAVRELEQAPRAGERLGAEVGADAVCQHRDAVEHHDPQQVVDLVAGQELRLVDEEARDVDGLPGDAARG